MIGIKDLNLDLLKELSEAFGPSGYEHRTVKIVKEYITPYVDEVNSDKTGSFIFEKKGKEDGPVVLMAGHVDEIGFIITHINDSGFLRFLPIGAWSNQTLLGQKVSIVTRKGKKLTGVICSVPQILVRRNDVIKKEDMFIDVGCGKRKEVEDMGVRIGDPVVPLSQFELIKNGSVAMGKAFDDRVGVFVILETIRFLKELGIEHPNRMVGAATVQEEIGVRGARTTVATVKPDISFAIESDVASDIPGIPEDKAFAKMGHGMSIVTYDGTMMPNIYLREYVIDKAEELEIPHQLSAIAAGGTDAGVFHLYERGCPSLVLGVPCRHIHTHVSLLSLEDVASCIRLLLQLSTRLDHKTVKDFTPYWTS